MSSTITAGNATNGLAISADNTGILELKTGTGSGTTALTLSTAQAATFASTVAVPTGTLYPIVSGTTVASTSGTSIDFTGIPSWVKRITVMFYGISTSGTSNLQVQLGTGATPTYTTTGYVSDVTTSANASTSVTSGLIFCNSVAAANIYNSAMVINSLGSNLWLESGVGQVSGGGARMFAGSITLGATLTAVRITTVNGTDTFDAGSINIFYE